MTSGLFAASATVALNLVTMSRGVAAGAIRPNQPIALYFGCPASAMVGTWGRRSRVAAHRQRLDRSRFDERNHSRHRSEIELRLVGDGGGHRRRSAFVR